MSIFELQNEKSTLRYFAVQRKEYRKAKKVILFKRITIIAFSIFSAFSALHDAEMLDAITSLLAIIVTVFTKQFDDTIKCYKKRAAEIQQYADTKLYSKMLESLPIKIDSFSWGNRLTCFDCIDEVSDKEYDDVKDWYGDYSKLPPQIQIYCCQRENIQWEDFLKKGYMNILIWVLMLLGIMFAMISILNNLTLIRFICALSWVIPVAENCVKDISCLKNDMDRLKKIENLCKTVDNKIKHHNTDLMDDLCKIQEYIFENREESYTIPEWYYRLKRNSVQKSKFNLASTINEQYNNLIESEV